MTSTDPTDSEGGSSETSWGIIGGGIAAFLIIVCIVVGLVVFVYKRRRAGQRTPQAPSGQQVPSPTNDQDHQGEESIYEHPRHEPPSRPAPPLPPVHGNHPASRGQHNMNNVTNIAVNSNHSLPDIANNSRVRGIYNFNDDSSTLSTGSHHNGSGNSGQGQNISGLNGTGASSQPYNGSVESGSHTYYNVSENTRLSEVPSTQSGSSRFQNFMFENV